MIGRRNGGIQRKTLIKSTLRVVLHRCAGLKVRAEAPTLFPGIVHIRWGESAQSDIAIKGRVGSRQLDAAPVQSGYRRLSHLSPQLKGRCEGAAFELEISGFGSETSANSEGSRAAVTNGSRVRFC